MAGHSQFANIMHRKGKQDAKRSKMFSKLSKEITVAAKLGAPDPAFNPRLRLAIQAAKAQSMPKDNIERAIKKATGGDGAGFEDVRYEGFGPGGIGVIVEVLTDNRNRAAGEVRAAFAAIERQIRCPHAQPARQVGQQFRAFVVRMRGGVQDAGDGLQAAQGQSQPTCATIFRRGARVGGNQDGLNRESENEEETQMLFHHQTRENCEVMG